jgi:hypothetical protein
MRSLRYSKLWAFRPPLDGYHYAASPAAAASILRRQEDEGRTVAENVAGAGLEGLVLAQQRNHKLAESISGAMPLQSSISTSAILWEQRVGGSNPSAPTNKPFSFRNLIDIDTMADTALL